ncbi:MAG: biopolymer transporter ExbD [Cryobacterium sp.]|nr:biopolymer transporter ExbD [Oligoflexia bacterium]
MKRKGFLKHSEYEQDFELNIASVIDCFVVLIAFILISSSFFSIGIIDAEVAGASEVAASDAGSLVVELKADHSILVRSSESPKNERILPKQAAKGIAWDFEGMAAALKAMKEKSPELKSAVVMADNAVTYRDVMASMEAAKKEVSSVNLGGF